jgi:hypothetical protein
MANFIMGIIGLSIGIVLLSSVFITTVKDTNQTYGCTTNATPNATINGTVCSSWSTAEIALWGLLTIVGIAGLVYGVLNVFGLV